MQEPSLATTIIAVLIAWIGIALYFVCTCARKDGEGCDPEHGCENCARFDNDKPVPAECSECLRHFPKTPNWIPAK